MPDHFPTDADISRWVPRAMVHQVRRFIQDYPETNKLVEGTETTDEQIARFILDIVDDFVYSPPVMLRFSPNAGQIWNERPLGAIRKWVVDMSAARTMKSIVNKLARNDMPYTAGNTTVQPEAVWRNIQPIIQDIEIQYKEFRDNYKIQVNLSSVWGSVFTDFSIGYFSDTDAFIIPGF